MDACVSVYKDFLGRQQ